MRLMQMDFFTGMEEQGITVAMDIDDVDPLEIFNEGIINVNNKIANVDFFNNINDCSLRIESTTY
ncbi:hypothetical protein P3X46_029068 [Hevea brasiliensis]|uniref:Uncharacterized protein n=1 Tax=Hevea brasiliensis TaxID=3981 RepID=A0ABQ9KSA6_HEVBR|nr:hypothetical protein P3X46_029068 [Hevea brasiliensis]